MHLPKTQVHPERPLLLGHMLEEAKPDSDKPAAVHKNDVQIGIASSLIASEAKRLRLQATVGHF